jgi:hypothetical protein
MTTISVPQDYIDQLNTPSSADEGIRLPFTAPVLWWKHGSKSLKQVGGVQYYGGWASNAEEFFAAIGEFGSDPHGFRNATYSGRDGDFDVYEGRAVAMAPIAIRKRWIVTPGTKGRSHLQMLCLMANQDGGNFVTWGPAVLSAKGLTTREIENTLRQFDSMTSEARKATAPGVPTLYFWRAIGTFGNEPNFQAVGSGNQQSTVTYPILYKPSAITPESIERWFVGNEAAALMVQLKAQAAEWIGDKQWRSGVPVAQVEETESPFPDIPDEMPF